MHSLRMKRKLSEVIVERGKTVKRASGILMHITSLPSREGIGTFGKSAYEFADFLKETGQSYWQILPLGPIGYGSSPYQSFSAFAGNPLLIDLEQLSDFLDDTDNLILSTNEDKVEFDLITEKKMQLLRKAYNNFKLVSSLQLKEFKAFKRNNKSWLNDYALFMSIKEANDNVGLDKWPEELRRRKKKALSEAKKQYEDDIEFWCFVQYIFDTQWQKLKAYVNSLGIKIIGDIPIYVSADSSDMWANPKLFKLDANNVPVTVAGCPPDAFTADGQLWGNPIYDWKYHKETNFEWWIKRIEHNKNLYDIVRIDHFRGFESFWEIPFGDKTARGGKWTKGPGLELFKAINEAVGDVSIIAEDLGFITEEVRQLRKDTGYPGMKILEFAFNPKEESEYLPHNYESDTVAYLGTHDNETIIGWYNNPVNKKDAVYAKKYVRLSKTEGYHWGFIKTLWGSPANLVLVQMQDLLGLGDEARMNIPSTIGGNWEWRMRQEALDEKIVKKLYTITKTYWRL